MAAVAAMRVYDMASRILVLFAHPAIHKSRVNRRLIRVYDEFENVTFRDLYDTYPEFMIDVPLEQDLLQQNDIVIFHHPFYWYSAPPILKQWMDLVLERGFAFGDGGTALAGKSLFSVITTGRDRDAYVPNNRETCGIRDYLLPFEQTAVFCGMHYLPPFVIHRVVLINGQAKFQAYLKNFREVLQELSRDDFEFQSIAKRYYMNMDGICGYLDTQESRDGD